MSFLLSSPFVKFPPSIHCKRVRKGNIARFLSSCTSSLLSLGLSLPLSPVHSLVTPSLISPFPPYLISPSQPLCTTSLLSSLPSLPHSLPHTFSPSFPPRTTPSLSHALTPSLPPCSLPSVASPVSLPPHPTPLPPQPSLGNGCLSAPTICHVPRTVPLCTSSVCHVFPCRLHAP